MTNQKSGLKVAVVTPYFRSDVAKLMRCCTSVARQTYACDHILVADGEVQEVFDNFKITHMQLPVNVGNSGATPRGMGAQFAFVQGYDVVAFLDADNWYGPDHIEKAVELLDQGDCEVVFANRHVVFPDGEVLEAADPQDEKEGHVDTNCYVFSKKVAYLMAVWTMWPKEFGVGEDRVMRLVIDRKKIRTARMLTKTVWYESNWPIHYALAHKKPVAPLRQPGKTVRETWSSQLFYEKTGIDLR